MFTPERLLRLFIEIIFLLLGVLMVWLGLTGNIMFNRHKISWLVLSLAVILWGLSAIYKPARFRSRGENWTRGITLTLLGVVLLSISYVPFAWVGPLLAFAGVLLAIRGILGAALILRPR